ADQGGAVVKKLLTLVALAASGFAGAADPAKPQAAADDAQDLILLAEGRPLLVRAHVRVDGKPFRAAWDNYVDRVFKFLDRNGDGVLDKAEVDCMPPTPLLIGGGPAIYGKGNPPTGGPELKDGKVTRDQFAAYLRRAGAAAFQFQMGGGGMGPYGVKVINLGDQQPTSAEALNDAIFELLDTNHDGSLSREELA